MALGSEHPLRVHSHEFPKPAIWDVEGKDLYHGELVLPPGELAIK